MDQKLPFDRAQIQLACDFDVVTKMMEELKLDTNARRMFAWGVKMGIESIAAMRENPDVCENYAPRPDGASEAEHFDKAVNAYIKAATNVINAN